MTASYFNFILIAAVLLSNQRFANAQIAKDNCKFLGNIISSSVPTDFGKYWNQVTPENSGKWGSVEGIKDQMNWSGLDLAYDYAKSKGYPFKQHTFVWGQQQPSWMSSLTNAEKKAQVEEWIQQYCQRYPDTDFIDVVNEPLHAVPDYAAALGGPGSTGWDWVIWSFEKARQYCPNAKLILNDYNIINSTTATSQYVQIINLLKDRQLIDYIGEQGHFLETTPTATITANLNTLYQTQLPILISEYDVNLANDTDQRNKYQEQFQLLWSHPGVKGITLWGYKEGQIWRADAYLVRSSGTERPALAWLKTYVPGTTAEDFCAVTAVDEQMNGLKFFPNPSIENRIKFENPGGNMQIEITDLQGRVLRTVAISGATTEELTLDLRPGIYIVNATTSFRKNIGKLVIQ